VGYITWFDEVNPCAVLEVIKPDVHVNGIEYGGDCIEAAVVKKNGGTIHLVDIVEGLSTSQIVEKIQKS
ncbi:MAG: D-glycero-beta-D-manno-heptose 1-phosphate adenylyltransferase, partial [Waddliaceae bacterium]|nr:D-glycero-beta-D-manno-heptose 1-phosphate adenylyltransferase [Waddliaceae bacterium]